MKASRIDHNQTFKARAAVIADQAHNPRAALGEGADFMRGLEENERQCEFFRLSYSSSMLMLS
jgi:GINS complex subunit 3